MPDAAGGDLNSEIDAEKWMADLARSTAEHKRVLAERPGAKALAKDMRRTVRLLYEWTDVTRSIAAVGSGHDPGESTRWYPNPGSAAAVEREDLELTVRAYVRGVSPDSLHWLETNPTRNPVDWGIDYLRRCVHTALDTLAAIASLTRSGRSFRSAIILSRAALEAASVGCYVIDVEVDDRERSRRILNLHLNELKEFLNESVGEGRELDLEREIEQLIGYAKHLGHEVKYRPQSWQSPVIISSTRSRPDTAKLMVEQVLPGGLGGSMWRSMSAIAHARQAHTPIADEYAAPHDVPRWWRTEMIAWHTLPTIAVLKQLCLRLEDYLGWDFAEWTQLLDFIALQWGAAAGLQDSAIRRSLGLG